MNTIIGIQGVAGSFHQVAQEYFNHEFVLDECFFEELIDNLMSNQIKRLWQSKILIGPIIPNYALIDKK
jgi:hypothetical protein